MYLENEKKDSIKWGFFGVEKRERLFI